MMKFKTVTLLAVAKKLVLSVTPPMKLQAKIIILIGLCVTCVSSGSNCVTVWELMFHDQSMLPNLSAQDA